jgi:hypothetical protein
VSESERERGRERGERTVSLVVGISLEGLVCEGLLLGSELKYVLKSVLNGGEGEGGRTNHKVLLASVPEEGLPSIHFRVS